MSSSNSDIPQAPPSAPDCQDTSALVRKVRKSFIPTTKLVDEMKKYEQDGVEKSRIVTELEREISSLKAKKERLRKQTEENQREIDLGYEGFLRKDQQMDEMRISLAAAKEMLEKKAEPNYKLRIDVLKEMSQVSCKLIYISLHYQA